MLDDLDLAVVVLEAPAVAAAGPTFHILTEGNDILATEAGDRLVTENAS